MSPVDSANPSITPTAKAPTPRVVTMNRGKRLWIISEETSMSRLTPPSTHTPDGMRLGVALSLKSTRRQALTYLRLEAAKLTALPARLLESGFPPLAQDLALELREDGERPATLKRNVVDRDCRGYSCCACGPICCHRDEASHNQRSPSDDPAAPQGYGALRSSAWRR